MYASRTDLEQAYGLSMVERLSIRPDDPDGSESVARALAYAEGLIDAQLSVRFALPLAAVPPMLTTIAVDLAIGRMATTADLGTDEMRRREDRARSELRQIAKGEMNLGLPSADAPLARPRPVLGPGGSKVFNRDSLRGL